MRKLLNTLVSMMLKINPPYACYDANYARAARWLLRYLHKGIQHTVSTKLDQPKETVLSGGSPKQKCLANQNLTSRR